MSKTPVQQLALARQEFESAEAAYHERITKLLVQECARVLHRCPSLSGFNAGMGTRGFDGYRPYLYHGGGDSGMYDRVEDDDLPATAKRFLELYDDHFEPTHPAFFFPEDFVTNRVER